MDEMGGPLAQADFCGSGVGSFGADATEDLLILGTPYDEREHETARYVSRRLEEEEKNTHEFVPILPRLI